MRGAPQSKFSVLIRRISARNSASIGGALPVDAISNANSGESRPDANVAAFRVE
jgi:hypothetical protein